MRKGHMVTDATTLGCGSKCLPHTKSSATCKVAGKIHTPLLTLELLHTLGKQPPMTMSSWASFPGPKLCWVPWFCPPWQQSGWLPSALVLCSWEFKPTPFGWGCMEQNWPLRSLIQGGMLSSFSYHITREHLRISNTKGILIL